MRRDVVRTRLRECWVSANNLRVSADRPDWTAEPTIHAIAVEHVHVDEQHRRQGHCKRFLERLCQFQRFQLVIVEGVQNAILANALMRWGWDFDSEVMDFYCNLSISRCGLTYSVACSTTASAARRQGELDRQAQSHKDDWLKWLDQSTMNGRELSREIETLRIKLEDRELIIAQLRRDLGRLSGAKEV